MSLSSNPTSDDDLLLPQGRHRRVDTPSAHRRCELDALRVVAMIAVVGLHASAAYLTVHIPGLLWVVREPAGSAVVEQFAWWAYGATMPAFFALAGFAATAVYDAKGARGFVVDRIRRIGLPFLAAIPAVLVPTSFIWLYGFLISGRCSFGESMSWAFADPEIRANRYGPAHLWFLEYLLGMLVVYVLIRWRSGSRLPVVDHGMSRFTSPWAPLILTIPTTFLLWAGHWFNGLDPILDLRNSFVINPLRWMHHGLFFLAGVGWYRGRDRLTRLTSGWIPWVLLASSALALTVRSTFLPRDFASSLSGVSAWLSTGSAAIFGWFTLYGLLGVCGQFGKRGGSTVKYLSDSSYWVYLVHFPIVGLIQANLFLFPIPNPVKFALALGAGMGWSLLTYEVLVRRTWVGRWLQGSKPRLATVPRPAVFDHAPTASPSIHAT
ncbi:MAG: hypothetical protein JWN86_1014 [Planctomycetota bacterium]|nr:hypothetical protein [Planctomycetota bacterium]